MQELLMTLARGAALGGMTMREYRRCTERQYLIEVLVSESFNQCRAARALGLHRNTLSRSLGAAGINVNKLRLEMGNRKPVATVKPAAMAAKIGA